jgi:hypothetical protein
MAEEGFPVAPIAAHLWEKGSAELCDPTNPHGQDMLLNGQAPRAGEIMTLPNLAATFKVCGDREGRGSGEVTSEGKREGGSRSLIKGKWNLKAPLYHSRRHDGGRDG